MSIEKNLNLLAEVEHEHCELEARQRTEHSS